MKPRAQANNTDDLTRWYQVPLLWMCIGLFLLILAGCVHLIVVSLEIDNAYPANTKPNGTLVFGIPLTRDDTSTNASQNSESSEQEHAAGAGSADTHPANAH
ncbi:MAG: hypothetical protein P1U67_00240 [Alcanivoracaceae bacterium]|nr:hypothetical protein [Alcanivoracaceae bacterium]